MRIRPGTGSKGEQPVIQIACAATTTVRANPRRQAVAIDRQLLVAG